VLPQARWSVGGELTERCATAPGANRRARGASAEALAVGYSFRVEPLLVPAHNPGPMTGSGNNTYLLVGRSGSAALIDAGTGDPRAVLTGYLTHRRQREQQVLAALRAGHATVQAIAESIYDGLAPALMPAAQENVRAHLEKLKTDGLAANADDRWTLLGSAF
jgi:hypothetical protein